MAEEQFGRWLAFVGESRAPQRVSPCRRRAWPRPASPASHNPEAPRPPESSPRPPSSLRDAPSGRCPPAGDAVRGESTFGDASAARSWRSRQETALRPPRKAGGAGDDEASKHWL